jgi:hypothetical protein
VTIVLTLRDLYALAYLDGLQHRPQITPSDPATTVRLDDADRPPLVALRVAEDVPCRHCSSPSVTDAGHIYGELTCCPDCDHRG